MNVEQGYPIVLSVVIALTMFIMSYIACSNFTLTKQAKIRYVSIFLLLAFLQTLDTFSNCVEDLGISSLVIVDFIANVLGFTLAPLIPILLASVLTKTKYYKIPYLIYFIYIIVYWILVGTGQAFTLTANAEYTRGPGFYYWYVPWLIIGFLYFFGLTIAINVRVLSSHPLVLVLLSFALLCAMGVQTFYPDIHVIGIIHCVVVIIFYNYSTSLFSQLDGLTSLYSQYTFRNYVNHIKENQKIVVMDIDNFKQLNDTMGHRFGDKILIEVAKSINFIFGKSGKCFRYGGDEFVAIINANANIDDLIEAFKAEIKSKENLGINVSIGYSAYNKGDVPLEVFDEADKKMYEDKAINKTRRIA